MIAKYLIVIKQSKKNSAFFLKIPENNNPIQLLYISLQYQIK